MYQIAIMGCSYSEIEWNAIREAEAQKEIQLSQNTAVNEFDYLFEAARDVWVSPWRIMHFLHHEYIHLPHEINGIIVSYLDGEKHHIWRGKPLWTYKVGPGWQEVMRLADDLPNEIRENALTRI